MTEPFYPPNRVAPRLVSKPRERLFDFYRERDHTRWSCDLIDHGRYGVEAQFWRNEEFAFSRRFDPFLDATRLSRELAVAWAVEERKALEQDPSAP